MQQEFFQLYQNTQNTNHENECRIIVRSEILNKGEMITKTNGCIQ